MNNINVYLRENLAAISAKNISIAPNIAEKKLNNAVKAFGYSGNPSSIIALYDNIGLTQKYLAYWYVIRV